MISIEIKFFINGREVSPEELEDGLENALIEGIKGQIREALEKVQCAEHHQPPRVTVTGSSLDHLGSRVEGCCQKLIVEALRALT